MKRERFFRKVLEAVHHYVVFFLIVAFLITCCTMLFVSVLAESMGIVFTSENIGVAAKLTFLNVVVLSLLLTVVDVVRRKITVERPVRRIIAAAEAIMKGDFSVRIPKGSGISYSDEFDEIAEYFNRMAKELGSIETLRGDFVANVSHELKTPLAVIKNYAVMLENPSLSDEERAEYAKAISAASGRLAGLITNILKLNKLENQQIVPRFVPYDLSEQLCTCLLAFEDVWSSKELMLKTDIEDGVTVESDAEMMSLVWNNLFSNAMKFTAKSGIVSVSLHADGEFATVCVKDTGCGISPEVGARMFDKFYQGDTSHATEGNGLGLALVRRVIDLTGSDISVESELGVGTAFTVKIKREAL